MPIFDRKPAPVFSSQVFRARLFRRPGAEPGTGGLNVVCGGCEHCAPDYRIDRPGFPYWCFELVVQGEGEVVAGGKASPLRPGAAFVYGPGTAYRMASSARDPLVKYFVDFSGRRAAPLLRELGFVPGRTALVFPPGEAGEAFDRLLDAGAADSPRSGRHAALLLEALLVGCADRRASSKTVLQRAFSTYRRCRDLLDGLDPAGPTVRGVEAAARACRVDPAYLSRLFRRFARTSPHRYLMRRRMTAAAARLAVPGTLVKEAAEEFGFADPYHFSRAFKAFHRVAPTEFLRRHRR